MSECLFTKSCTKKCSTTPCNTHSYKQAKHKKAASTGSANDDYAVTVALHKLPFKSLTFVFLCNVIFAIWFHIPQKPADHTLEAPALKLFIAHILHTYSLSTYRRPLCDVQRGWKMVIFRPLKLCRPTHTHTHKQRAQMTNMPTRFLF